MINTPTDNLRTSYMKPWTEGSHVSITKQDIIDTYTENINIKEEEYNIKFGNLIQPPQITTSLFHYQKRALYEAIQNEINGGSIEWTEKDDVHQYNIPLGIIDLPPGDGKTLVAISIMANPFPSENFQKSNSLYRIINSVNYNNNIYPCYYNHNHYKHFRNICLNKSVVFCSRSVSRQWESEIKKHSSLKVISFFRPSDWYKKTTDNYLKFRKCPQCCRSKAKIGTHGITNEDERYYCELHAKSKYRGDVIINVLQEKVNQYLMNADADIIIIDTASAPALFEIYDGDFNRNGVLFSRVFFDDLDVTPIPNFGTFYGLYNWFLSGTSTHIIHNFINKRNTFFKCMFHGLSRIIKHITIGKYEPEFVYWSKSQHQLNVHTTMFQRKVLCKVRESFRLMINVMRGKNERLLDLVEQNDIEGIKRLLFDADDNTDTTPDYSRIDFNARTVLEGVRQKLKQMIDNLSDRIETLKDDKVRKQLVIEKSELEGRIHYLNQNEISTCENSNKIECTVCYDVLHFPIIITCCKNLFCSKCARRLYNCTTCRNTIGSNGVQLVPFHGSVLGPIRKRKTVIIEDDDDDSNGFKPVWPDVPQSKEVMLKIMIQELIWFSETNGLPVPKIILVSGLDRNLSKIKDYLGDELKTRMNMIHLQGTSNMISHQIEAFKNSTTPSLLLLSSVNHASGINLPFVTDIIFYHSLGESFDTQVLGRSLRCDRILPVLRVQYLQYQYQ